MAKSPKFDQAGSVPLTGGHSSGLPSSFTTSGIELADAAKHPVLGRYFVNGQPDAQSLMKAPDEQLRQHVALLSPNARTQLGQQLASFQPSFGQRIGAKAMGIDIEGQRKRFAELLGKAAAWSGRNKQAAIPFLGTGEPEDEHSLFYNAFHSPAALTAMTLLPAVGAYGAARHVNTAGMSAERAAIAKRIRDRGLAYEHLGGEKMPAWKRYLQYGTPHVYNQPEAWAGRGHGAVWAPQASLVKNEAGHLPAGWQAGPGKKFLYHEGTPVLGAAVENPALANKTMEAKFFQQHAPGLMPESHDVNELLTAHRQGSLVPANKLERVRELETGLKRQFPRGYIVKGPDDSQSAGTLMTDKNKMEDVWNRYGRYGWKERMSLPPEAQKIFGYPTASLEEIQQLNEIPGMSDKFLQLTHVMPDLRQHMHLRHHVGDLTGPVSGLLAQERMQLNKVNPVQGVVDRILNRHSSPVQEYRAHILGDEVLPMTSARHSPSEYLANIFGYRSSSQKQIDKTLQEHFAKLPREGSQLYASDVAMTPAGPKVLEANPSGTGGTSGFLRPNPGGFGREQMLSNHQLVSALQGRKTHLLSALNAAQAGGLGAAAYGTGRLMSNAAEPGK